GTGRRSRAPAEWLQGAGWCICFAVPVVAYNIRSNSEIDIRIACVYGIDFPCSIELESSSSALKEMVDRSFRHIFIFYNRPKILHGSFCLIRIEVTVYGQSVIAYELTAAGPDERREVVDTCFAYRECHVKRVTVFLIHERL